MRDPGRGRARGEEAGDSVWPVVLWLATFAAIAWGLDQLLRWAGSALPLASGGRTLRWARQPISLVLALVLSLYAVALQGEWRRRRLGLAPACGDEEDEEAAAPRGVRGSLPLGGRLAARALRGGGVNDDVGCGGIVAILLGATVALPLAAEAIHRATGYELPGAAGLFLWLALSYGGFVLRGLWKMARRSA